MPTDIATGRYHLPCQACGAHTEVTPRVHDEVGLSGMRIRCWSCGAEMTIPPHPGRIDHERRRMVDLGMILIAGGALDRGKAMLHASERLGDEWAHDGP